MDRSIPLLLIGLLFGGGIGFTIAAANGIVLGGHGASGPDHPSGQAVAATAPAMGHDHAMVQPLMLEASDTSPSVTATLARDPVSGWNLHVQRENFRFAPENAGLANVPGEGHAHVYVNGVKIARLYADWMHVATLEPGENVLKVALYTNDHRPIHVGGAPVSASVRVEADPADITWAMP